MLKPVLKNNDRTAKWLIWTVSIVVFLAVAMLSKIKLEVNPGFDVHIFAQFNAIINTVVAFLLIAGLMNVRANLKHIKK